MLGIICRMFLLCRKAPLPSPTSSGQERELIGVNVLSPGRPLFVVSARMHRPIVGDVPPFCRVRLRCADIRERFPMERFVSMFANEFAHGLVKLRVAFPLPVALFPESKLFMLPSAVIPGSARLSDVAFAVVPRAGGAAGGAVDDSGGVDVRVARNARRLRGKGGGGFLLKFECHDFFCRVGRWVMRQSKALSIC